MKRAIVTGSTSLIGTHLIKQLIQNDFYILAIVRPGSERLYRLPQKNTLKVLELDNEDIYALPSIICEKYDVFFHLAWEGTRAPLRDNRELQEKNYFTSINAIKAAAKLGCSTFIGTGSQAEYGQFNGKVDESSKADPLTEYGKAKLLTYLDGQKVAHELNMKFIWTRIFSIYGEDDYLSTMIMTCINKMLKNEDVLLTQCMQNWDYIYVDDAVDALVKLIEFGRDGEVYNIASGISKPLREFVLDIKSVINSKSTLNFGAVEYGKDGPVSFEPVVEKLKKDLNWSAKTEFKDGIANIVKFVRENQK